MKFKNKLISGLLIKRYKRFFVDVKVNNQIITAHCPNTGSMYTQMVAKWIINLIILNENYNILWDY